MQSKIIYTLVVACSESLSYSSQFFSLLTNAFLVALFASASPVPAEARAVEVSIIDDDPSLLAMTGTPYRSPVSLNLDATYGGATNYLVSPPTVPTPNNILSKSPPQHFLPPSSPHTIPSDIVYLHRRCFLSHGNPLISLHSFHLSNFIRASSTAQSSP